MRDWRTVPIAGAAGPPKRVVCHLIERLEYGGGEMLVHSLATGMRDSAYEPIVCCLQPGAVARQLERDGIRVHTLDLRRRSVVEGPLFIVFIVRLLWTLTRLIKAERVAIVHAHLPDSIIWASLAGTIARTPIVGTYHGLGIVPKGRRPWDPRNAIRRAFYRLAGRLASRTIAVSPPVLDLLRGSLGLDPRRTVLVVNGVDTNRFAAAVPCSRTRTDVGLENRTIITSVGRFVAGKGHRFLIEAMASVVQRHPDAALLLVGNGPERAALENLVRDLKLSNDVRFASERGDVPELLAMSAVFVLPSFSEGIPLALVEAMAAGTPVVATAVPGNLDVVVDDRFGLLVPAGDAPAIADAICSLLDDPSRAREVAARAQEHAHTHFDARRSIAATAALYDEVLAERSSRTDQRP